MSDLHERQHSHCSRVFLDGISVAGSRGVGEEVGEGRALGQEEGDGGGERGSGLRVEGEEGGRRRRRRSWW